MFLSQYVIRGCNFSYGPRSIPPNHLVREDLKQFADEVRSHRMIAYEEGFGHLIFIMNVTAEVWKEDKPMTKL
jgi:hypothetical protein